ncbi:hypothetical protein [Lutibacter flavus]|uniref:Uncharacterized protein n=1 Tax=Lutibacter flavus TaxID=691689 RepID=A0A238VHF3_9FLAO|nr:hypothetical protein [Lutibacter flavus]SNR33825.1 hypothetical protein SAMN04488111_0512 [Lutibacter flavus]
MKKNESKKLSQNDSKHKETSKYIVRGYFYHFTKNDELDEIIFEQVFESKNIFDARTSAIKRTMELIPEFNGEEVPPEWGFDRVKHDCIFKINIEIIFLQDNGNEIPIYCHPYTLVEGLSRETDYFVENYDDIFCVYIKTNTKNFRIAESDLKFLLNPYNILVYENKHKIIKRFEYGWEVIEID